MKRILLRGVPFFIFISFKIFSDYEKEINNLLEKQPKEIETIEQSLTDQHKKELCRYLIDNYTKTFLQVIKPGLASFPYIRDRKFKKLNKTYGQCKLVGDGKILMAVNLDTREADIWSLTEEEPQLIKSIQLPLGTKYVEISQDAKYIVTRVNHGDTITVFNLATNESENIALMKREITDIAFSPDSTFMLVAFRAKPTLNAPAEIFKFDLDNELRLLCSIDSASDYFDTIKSISMSKDGKYALFCNSDSVYLYDFKVANPAENIIKKIDGIPENKIKFCTFVANSQFAYVLAEGPACDKCYCISIKDANAIYCVNMPISSEFSFFGNDTRCALVRHGDSTSLINLEQFSDCNENKIASYTWLIWRSLGDWVNPQGTLWVTIEESFVNRNKLMLYDTSGWAIEELSLTALLVLIKIDQSKEQKEIFEYCNFLRAYFEKRHSLLYKELEKFVRKKLVELSFDAPQVLQDLVKEFI